MPDFAVAGGKGKTKHRASSNKKRTVKAASTYGEAYRKYVKMYGGQQTGGEEVPPKNGEEVQPKTEKAQPTNEEPGIMAKVASALGIGEKKKEEVVKPQGEDNNSDSSGSETEDDPERANEKEGKEREKNPEGEEPGIFSSVKAALSGAEEKISEEKDSLEQNIAKGRETLTAAANDTVSQLANGVKDTTERVSSNIISGISNLTTGPASTPMSDNTTMTNQNESARNEAISTLAGEAVGTSMSAAERALESMKDALKAFQLALAAVETVIGATKASVVASSVTERMQTPVQTPMPTSTSTSTPTSSVSPVSSSDMNMSPSMSPSMDSNGESLKDMNAPSSSYLSSSESSSLPTDSAPETPELTPPKNNQ